MTSPAHPKHPHPRLAMLATLAASLALAACGGGDVAPGAGGATPAPAPAPAPVPAPPPPVAAVPVITADLPATLTIREGDTGTLTVAASSPGGSALAYRWLRNEAELPSAGTAATATVQSHPFATSYAAETWQAELRNAAGATLSASTRVLRVPRQWLDLSTAHAAQGAVDSGDTRQRVRFTDLAGRIHEASVHDSSAGGVLAFRGESLDSADGGISPWGYSAVLPASSPGAQLSQISLAATHTGEIVAAWLEVVQGEVDRHLVRAALYRPGATAAQAGTWVSIGTVSDPAQEASEPTVVQVGADVFGIAWLQRSGAGQPRSALQRRYLLPAAGSPAESGLGSVFAMESVDTDISRLRLLGAGPQLALMFVEASGSQPARWQYATSPSGVMWSALAELGADERFAEIHWAPPANGRTVLATADGNGRLFTRRVDLAAGTWLDGEWSYTANAYGSAPALLIDAEGRIDVFGVSVATASGHTSVLGHWVYTPSGGWGSGTVLASSATDFREGLGLRTPQAGRDAAGNLVLAWAERSAASAPQRVRVQRYSSFSAGWTDAADLAAPAAAGQRQAEPLLTVHENGRATASWVEASGDGSALVRHARLR